MGFTSMIEDMEERYLDAGRLKESRHSRVDFLEKEVRFLMRICSTYPSEIQKMKTENNELRKKNTQLSGIARQKMAENKKLKAENECLLKQFREQENEEFLYCMREFCDTVY